jgi:hypothetical protein
MFCWRQHGICLFAGTVSAGPAICSATKSLIH